MARRSKIKVLIYALLALFLLVVTVISGRVTLSAFADTVGYTSVLEDLTKDDNFKVSDYPDKKNIYSISVIQIAESTAGELFVYTYQPCQKTRYLVATEINMALTENLGGEASDNDDNQSVGGILGGIISGVPGAKDDTKLYGLTLLNSNGVFCKYKVKDFTVSNDEIRYYNITSIYREWIKGIDKETGNDNTKNAVAFPVSRCYKATTENGGTKYECKETEVIEIRNPVAGYLEYPNGFKFFPDRCHSHYIAFSTDKKIDTLLEADVSYISREASRSTGLGLDGHISYENEREIIAKLNGEQKGGNTADGWWAEKYEWKRIQTVEEFKSDKDHSLSDSAVKKLEGQKWVLRFVETKIVTISGYSSTTLLWTDISNVTILRLKFVTAGKVYNLGAVSDKVTEGDTPDGFGNKQVGFWEYVWNCIVKLFKGTATLVEQIVAVVAIFIALLCIPAIMLILSIFFPVVRTVLKTVFNGIWIAIKYLFIGLWYVISSPVRLIIWIVRKIKGDG